MICYTLILARKFVTEITDPTRQISGTLGGHKKVGKESLEPLGEYFKKKIVKKRLAVKILMKVPQRKVKLEMCLC